MPCNEIGSECVECHNIGDKIFKHHCKECVVCLIIKNPKSKEKIVLDVL